MMLVGGPTNTVSTMLDLETLEAIGRQLFDEEDGETVVVSCRLPASLHAYLSARGQSMSGLLQRGVYTTLGAQVVDTLLFTDNSRLSAAELELKARLRIILFGQ